MYIINEYNFRKVNHLRRATFWLAGPVLSFLLVFDFRGIVLYFMAQLTARNDLEQTAYNFLKLIYSFTVFLLFLIYLMMGAGIIFGIRHLLKVRVANKIQNVNLKAEVNPVSVALDSLYEIIRFSLIGILSLMIGSIVGGPSIMYLLFLINRLVT